MTILIICTVIAMLSIASIIYGNNQREEGWQATGWIVGLLDLGIGFGVLCLSLSTYRLEHQVKFTYAKTESYVMVEFNDNNHTSSATFTDAYTYNNIDSTTVATSFTQYDVYGFSCGSGFELNFITDKKLK